MTVTWARRVLASLVAALAVAVVAHVSQVLAFFLSNQMQGPILQSASDYFFLTSVFAFLLVFIAAMIGGIRDWKWALPVGVIVAFVAIVAAMIIKVAQAGQPLNGENWGYILGTFIGLNTIYFVATIVLVPTVGRALYKWIVGYHEAPHAADRRIAIVRLPAKNLAEGTVTHIEASEVDADLADKQWDAYVAAFEENGWETTEAAFAGELADSVFVEDTVVLFGNLAVITRPGIKSRREEVDAVEDTVLSLNFEVERIMAPGTLDGGDVLKVGNTVYVGRSGRTNAEGIRQLRSLITPLGYSVIGVPHTKALHLKSAITALPDGTFIGNSALLDEPALFPGFIEAREPEGVAVVVLSDETILIAASAPRTAELLEDLGYNVVTVDISEFEKLEGCVTCLSVRVR